MQYARATCRYACVTPMQMQLVISHILTTAFWYPAQIFARAGDSLGARPSKNRKGGSSLVPTPRAPPSEKRSGERSRISWAYSPKRWKTNEIVKSLIIT